VQEIKVKDNNLEQLQKLNSKLTACRQVVETLETPGWKKIIQPIIDKMIKDVIGGRDGEYWDSGQIKGEVFKQYKTEHMLGYRQSLIDLHNRIWAYKGQIKQLEQQISGMQSRTEVDVQPMQRSPYSPEPV